MHDPQAKGLWHTLRSLSGWSEWLAYLDLHGPHGRAVRPQELATLLRRFVHCDNCSVAQLLRAIRSRFSIDRLMTLNPYGAIIPGEGWARIRESTSDLSAPEIQVAVGKANYSRRWSVEAHEIGHIFYAALPPQGPASQPVDFLIRNPDVEQFCWQFAIDLLCPSEKRAMWNAKYIRDLHIAQDTTGSERLENATVGLTFMHLREIARTHHLSIRMVVTLLDRHQLLSELEVGIAILRRMLNPKTRRDMDLRVAMVARPAWGHLIVNQRASRQGFSEAGMIFERGIDQVTKTFNDCLKLRFRNSSEGLRWIVGDLNTPCSYTPVDVVGEGRYVLVLWKWPPAKNT